MTQKAWFKRGQSGLGHFPQSWEGWASFAAFLVALVSTVLILQTFLGDGARGQSVIFLAAAFEIMAFLRFVRSRSTDLKTTEPKK